MQSNEELWESTAILVTVDEGGGYYDSGYIQPVDYFGDGTRIPMLVVSKYSQGGHVSHEYSDHASIVKFIERNWYLPSFRTAAATICRTRRRRTTIPMFRRTVRRSAISGAISRSPMATTITITD